MWNTGYIDICFLFLWTFKAACLCKKITQGVVLLICFSQPQKTERHISHWCVFYSWLGNIDGGAIILENRISAAIGARKSMSTSSNIINRCFVQYSTEHSIISWGLMHRLKKSEQTAVFILWIQHSRPKSRLFNMLKIPASSTFAAKVCIYIYLQQVILIKLITGCI